MIYAKGISKLCQVLFSKLADFDRITFIQLINSYNLTNDEINTLIKEETNVIRILEDCFKVEINILGPFLYKLGPLSEGIFRKRIYPDLSSKIKLNSQDSITSNLVTPLRKLIKSNKLVIIAEGASMIRALQPNRFSINIFAKKFYRKYISRFKELDEISKEYIFTDNPESDIKNLGENSKIKEKVKVIPFSIIRDNRNLLFNYLEKLDPDLINMRGIKFFHPAHSYLTKEEQEITINQLKDVSQNKQVLFKPHPTDRSWESYPLPKNFVRLPKKFEYFPAETFYSHSINIQYVGYYSTTMLSFSKTNITLIEPPNKNIVKLYNKEFSMLTPLYKDFSR